MLLLPDRGIGIARASGCSWARVTSLASAMVLDSCYASVKFGQSRDLVYQHMIIDCRFLSGAIILPLTSV